MKMHQVSTGIKVLLLFYTLEIQASLELSIITSDPEQVLNLIRSESLTENEKKQYVGIATTLLYERLSYLDSFHDMSDLWCLAKAGLYSALSVFCYHAGNFLYDLRRISYLFKACAGIAAYHSVRNLFHGCMKEERSEKLIRAFAVKEILDQARVKENERALGAEK